MIWEDLMPNPPTDLQDLMSWVEMFACLGDDVRQAKQASGSSSRGDGSFKRHKERTTDNEDRVRQGINVVFKTSCTTESLPPWRTPQKTYSAVEMCLPREKMAQNIELQGLKVFHGSTRSSRRFERIC